MDENEEIQETPELDTNETPDAGGQPEKNFQAETKRKLESMNQRLTESNLEVQQRLEQIIQAVQAAQPSGTGYAPAAAPKRIAELMIDDPDAAVAEITNQVTKTVSNQMLGAIQKNDSFKETAKYLEAEYPELKTKGSEGFNRVVQYHNALPASMQGTSQGIENAALKAAQDFGLIPKSKRVKTTTSDDFQAAPTGSGDRARTRGNQGKKGMSEAQKAFASLLGAPVNDPKFAATFEKANNRQVWTQYKGEGED